MANEVNNQSGTEKPAWMAQLSSDLQGNESLTQFKSLSDLGKAFLDAHGKTQNSIQMPREGATEQEIGDFHKRLGRPDSPDQYVIKRPELPEGMNYDESEEKFYRAELHKIGLSQKQVERLFELENGRRVEQFKSHAESQVQAKKGAEQELRKAWGNEYDSKLELAGRTAAFMGGQKLIEELNRTGLGNLPALAQCFAGFGAKISDPKFVDGSTNPVAPARNPGQLEYPNTKV